MSYDIRASFHIYVYSSKLFKYLRITFCHASLGPSWALSPYYGYHLHMTSLPPFSRYLTAAGPHRGKTSSTLSTKTQVWIWYQLESQWTFSCGDLCRDLSLKSILEWKVHVWFWPRYTRKRGATKSGRHSLWFWPSYDSRSRDCWKTSQNKLGHTNDECEELFLSFTFL